MKNQPTLIYIYINISSSHSASTDLPDSLSSFVPIIHRFRQVFLTTSCIRTKLLYVSPCSSLLPQQYPACLVRLIWMVFEIGGRWLYSWFLVGWCFQGLFSIGRSIFVQFRLAFSLYVLSASIWCIHTVELTQPLLGRNCVLFYRIVYILRSFHTVIHQISISDYHNFVDCVFFYYSYCL